MTASTAPTSSQRPGVGAIDRPQMVCEFPEPPALVKEAFGELAKPLAPPKSDNPHADADALQELKAAHAKLPRPWIPASCAPRLRNRVWLWLEDVARWLNREYLWQPKTMIPPCWIVHPHIVHELAALACLRRAAEQEPDAKGLEEWHRHSLPMFVDRMEKRLDGKCNNGQEHPAMWPGQPQQIEFLSEENIAARRQWFELDIAADGGRALPATAPRPDPTAASSNG